MEADLVLDHICTRVTHLRELNPGASPLALRLYSENNMISLVADTADEARVHELRIIDTVPQQTSATSHKVQLS